MYYSDDPASDYESYMQSLEKEQERKEWEEEQWRLADIYYEEMKINESEEKE